MTAASPNDSSFRTIFLTGATGFVGVHAAHELVRSGYRVRCLVRKGSERKRLPEAVELIEGALSDEASLRQGVEGCWGVMHIGGIVRARNMDEFLRVNRDGTALLAKVAREAGVERFTLCSSQAAGGPGTRERRRSVDDPPAPVTYYGRSKLAGEEALAENAGNLWWSIIRPPAVYGPYDYAFFTFVEWVKWGFKLRLGDGRNLFALIHVEDLARALRLALEADAPSGRIWYATDGVNHTLFDMGDAVEKAVGKKAIWIPIPMSAAPAIARVIETIANARGEIALLSRQKVIELTQPAWTCDDEPLRRETGYQNQFDLTSGMAQTVRWYREKGWI